MTRLFFSLAVGVSLAGPLSASPRLVVLVVGDQVRADYLGRWQTRLIRDGLRRFTEQGTYYSHAQIDHAVTVTAPGNVLIASGLYPHQSGIVANRWYDESLRLRVRAADRAPSPGRVRLSWFQGPSLAERIHQKFPGSRFVSVSWKDRSALLLGGPDQDEACWWDSKQRRFVCHGPAPWLKPWNEQAEKERKRLGGDFYSDLLVERLAELAIDAWQLGANPHAPDFLAVGFSAVDLVGHRFGPDAAETAEAFARLDRAVGDLMRYVERRVKGDVVWVFASDHGVTPLPEERRRKGELAGRVDFRRRKLPHPGWIAAATSPFITLDEKALARKGVTRAEAEMKISAALTAREGVQAVYSESEILNKRAPAVILRSYWKPGPGDGRRCGHLWVVLKPGYIFSEWRRGTTHGQPHVDDQQVPLAFYGAGIPAQTRTEPVSVSAVAPTVLKLLGIPAPDLVAPLPF